MKKVLLVFLSLSMLFNIADAKIYPNMTVRDTDGDALKVNSSGSIDVSFSGGDNIDFTYGVTAATGTFSNKLTVTGANGIVNTYGITSGTITASGFTKTATLEVTGASALQGQATFTLGPIIPVVDITVSTPTAVGQLIRSSASSGVVYVSTGTADLTGWVKIGGQ